MLCTYIEQPTQDFPRHCPSCRSGLDGRVFPSNHQLTVHLQFGSKQTSPQIRDGTLRGRFDGPDDILFTQSPTSATSSPEGSPLQIVHHQYTTTGGAQHHGLHPGTHGWESAAQPTTRLPTGPVSTVPAVTAGLASSQHRASATSSPATGRTPSPASLVGSFPPFGGTSPNEFPYQHLQDRFPFSGTEAHAPAAIRG